MLHQCYQLHMYVCTLVFLVLFKFLKLKSNDVCLIPDQQTHVYFTLKCKSCENLEFLVRRTFPYSEKLVEFNWLAQLL